MGFPKLLLKKIGFSLIFLILIGNGLILLTSIHAETTGAAIQNVYYNPKIYDGDSELFDFIIYNYGIEGINEEPLFFMRLYANSKLIYDEFFNPWPCKKGIQTSHRIEIANWRGPQKYTIEAHLFFLNKTIPILLDVKRFELTVVKLFIDEWEQKPETLFIEWNSKIPKILTISFKNGGNDFMFNASIEIIDSAGLRVEPIHLRLGDIKAKEVKIVNYSVLALASTEIGNKALKFQIEYFDFKGIAHKELKIASIEVTKLETNIVLSYEGETKIGSTLLLIAKLTDKNDEPIPNEKIYFFIDSMNIGYNITNEVGIAYLNHTLNLDAGKYSLKAVFQGSLRLASSNTSITLNVSKISTFIEARLPSSFIVDKPIAIPIILKNEKGEPLPDQEIKLYINASQPLINKTDINGKALISLTIKKKGNYSLIIVYEGNKNFLGARYEKSIIVNPIQTKLTLKLPWLPLKGSQITISAFLKDEENKPIPNAVIKFFIKDDGKTKELGSSITDAKGVASINYELYKDGKVEVFAIYEGSQKYSESEAITSLNIINIVLLLGILSAATLSIIGTFLFLKFKRGIDIISEIKKRIQKSRFLHQPPVIKRVDVIEPISEGITYDVKNCIYCGNVIPKNAYFCDKCGKRQDIKDFQGLDDKVYNYIVEHRGTISLSKACMDLGITLEELKASIERLKKAGKLI